MLQKRCGLVTLRCLRVCAPVTGVAVDAQTGAVQGSTAERAALRRGRVSASAAGLPAALQPPSVTLAGRARESSVPRSQEDRGDPVSRLHHAWLCGDSRDTRARPPGWGRAHIATGSSQSWAPAPIRTPPGGGGGGRRTLEPKALLGEKWRQGCGCKAAVFPRAHSGREAGSCEDGGRETGHEGWALSRGLSSLPPPFSVDSWGTDPCFKAHIHHLSMEGRYVDSNVASIFMNDLQRAVDPTPCKDRTVTPPLPPHPARPPLPRTLFPNCRVSQPPPAGGCKVLSLHRNKVGHLFPGLLAKGQQNASS